MAKKKETPLDGVAVETSMENKPINRDYEEWKVKPIYEKQRSDDGTMINVCTGFEKDAQKAIRVTRISPDKAAILNSQSENTLVHLFEI